MPQFRVDRLRPDAEVELPAEESRHALKSLRLAPGDRITLFDGTGDTCDAEILRVSGTRVVARAGPRRAAAPGTTIVIASALPKGKRLGWMIQKLAELGVAKFVPVAFQRSVVRWSASRAGKMEKIAVEAAKQSGRATFLEFGPECRVEDLAGGVQPTFVAMPGAGKTLLASLAGPVRYARVVIGPEGGMTPEEVERIGGTPVSLGGTILRIETAAVAAAAVLAQS